MRKVAVVYWNGNAPPERMASAVLDGVKEKGTEGVILTLSAFNPFILESYDIVAFGCPHGHGGRLPVAASGSKWALSPHGGPAEAGRRLEAVKGDHQREGGKWKTEKMMENRLGGCRYPIL